MEWSFAIHLSSLQPLPLDCNPPIYLQSPSPSVQLPIGLQCPPDLQLPRPSAILLSLQPFYPIFITSPSVCNPHLFLDPPPQFSTFHRFAVAPPPSPRWFATFHLLTVPLPSLQTPISISTPPPPSINQFLTQCLQSPPPHPAAIGSQPASTLGSQPPYPRRPAARLQPAPPRPPAPRIGCGAHASPAGRGGSGHGCPRVTPSPAAPRATFLPHRR